MNKTTNNPLLSQYMDQVQPFFSDEIVVAKEAYEVYTEQTGGFDSGTWRIRDQNCCENNSFCGLFGVAALVFGCLSGELCQSINCC